VAIGYQDEKERKLLQKLPDDLDCGKKCHKEVGYREEQF